jgi:hypothetical protein
MLGLGHELRASRVGNRRREDALDFPHRRFIERPARYLAHRIEVLRSACSPERDRGPLVEDPAHREQQDVFSKIFSREASSSETAARY